MKNKKLLKVLLIALLFTAAGVVFTIVKSGSTQSDDGIVTETVSEEGSDGSSSLQAETEDEDSGSDTGETTSGMLCVYVCGAVNNSGVYYLEAGSRVHEAVEMAGGLTEDAAEEYINLAQELEDGQQVYIPTLEEALEQGLSVGSSASSSGTDSSDGLININTATSEQLQTLSGIGESKAAAIISYREENGDFGSIEDIKNVSGIGDSTYEKIKDYITV